MTHPMELPTPANENPQPLHKPSNWWAIEREPWKRIGRELAAHADALAARRRADEGLAAVYASAGTTFGAFVARSGAAARSAGDAKADAVCAGLTLLGAVLPIAPDDYD